MFKIEDCELPLPLPTLNYKKLNKDNPDFSIIYNKLERGAKHTIENSENARKAEALARLKIRKLEKVSNTSEQEQLSTPQQSKPKTNHASYLLVLLGLISSSLVSLSIYYFLPADKGPDVSVEYEKGSRQKVEAERRRQETAKRSKNNRKQTAKSFDGQWLLNRSGGTCDYRFNKYRIKITGGQIKSTEFKDVRGTVNSYGKFHMKYIWDEVKVHFNGKITKKGGGGGKWKRDSWVIVSCSGTFSIKRISN